MKSKKIFIGGGTGSGKTTLSRRISEILGISSYASDDFVYKKKWSEKYSSTEQKKNLEKVLKKKNWIIEGVHMMDWTIPALKQADITIFLNVSKGERMKRIWKRRRSGRNSLCFLAKLIYWVFRWGENYYLQYEKYSKKPYIILKNNQDIDKFIESLKKEKNEI